MTWAERLDATKQVLKITSDIELCKLLNITRQTLHYWKTGRSAPSTKNAKRLYKICKLNQWGSEAFGKEVYLSQFTVAYDSARDMYQTILQAGDDISISNAVHSVLVKIAHLLREKLKVHKIDPIIHIHSIFGEHDYGQIANIQCVTPNGKIINKKADVCVKIGHVHNELDMLFIIEAEENGILKLRRGGNVTDININKAVTAIGNFFKSKLVSK